MIRRGSRRTPADGQDYDNAPWVEEWLAHIDRANSFSLTWDAEHAHPEQRYIVTQASFPFDQDVDGDEEFALERARAYCVDVAHEVAALRPSLEGLVERVERTIADAVRQHRAVPLKMH